MRVSLPKFVIAAALIAASLTACSMPNEQGGPSAEAGDSNFRASRANGLETKTGKALSVTEMCALPSVDANGKTTVATLRFQTNAKFFRRTRAMTDKSLFVIEQEATGTWSVFGETLLITENGKTVHHPIEIFNREADGSSCVRFPSTDGRPEYCACGFN